MTNDKQKQAERKRKNGQRQVVAGLEAALVQIYGMKKPEINFFYLGAEEYGIATRDNRFSDLRDKYYFPEFDCVMLRNGREEYGMLPSNHPLTDSAKNLLQTRIAQRKSVRRMTDEELGKEITDYDKQIDERKRWIKSEKNEYGEKCNGLRKSQRFWSEEKRKKSEKKDIEIVDKILKEKREERESANNMFIRNLSDYQEQIQRIEKEKGNLIENPTVFLDCQGKWVPTRSMHYEILEE